MRRKDEDGKLRLTNDEQTALTRLAVLRQLCSHEMNVFDGRLEDFGLKRLKSSVGMLKWTSTDILEGIKSTVPSKQLNILNKVIDNSTFSTGWKGRGYTNDRDEGTWISIEDLGLFYYTVMNSHCMMCEKNKQEQRQCEVKRLLDLYPNAFDENERGLCPYFGTQGLMGGI